MPVYEPTGPAWHAHRRPGFPPGLHGRWMTSQTASAAELKTYQRGAGRVLRSKSPEMVTKEIYAHLLVHYAIAGGNIEVNTPIAIRSVRRSSSEALN